MYYNVRRKEVKMIISFRATDETVKHINYIIEFYKNYLPFNYKYTKTDIILYGIETLYAKCKNEVEKGNKI